MKSPNDPFGNSDGKLFRKYTELAGFTVALGAAAAVIAIGLTQGGNHKKPKHNPVARIAPPAPVDHGGAQGRQLAAEVTADAEKGKKTRINHFQGVLAVYDGAQPPTVVVNPYVAPAAGVKHPQVNANVVQRDYDYFALIARRDPATGKISFAPDEVLAAGQDTNADAAQDTNYGPYVMLSAESIQNRHPIESSTVQAGPLTYWHSPNNFSFTAGDYAAVKLLGSYTYSIVGNELLVPPPVRTGNNIRLEEPVGVLLQAHPAGNPAP